MKKMLAIVLFAIATGQVTAQRSLYLLPKFGPTFGSYSVNEPDLSPGTSISKKVKVGYQLGLGFENDFKPQWGVRIEMLFSHQPAYFSRNSTGINTNGLGEQESVSVHDISNYTFNYLEIPILAKFTSGDLYFLGGFSVKTPISGKEQGVETQNGIPTAASYPTSLHFGPDPGDQFKSEEIAVQFGVGYKLHVGTSDFSAELRYSKGLTNFSNIPNETVHSSIFGLTINYFLPLAKK